MKITAPDYEDASSGDKVKTKDKTSFEDEIKDILKISCIPQKYIAEDSSVEDLNFKLKVLHNFTQFCREEIIPRHRQAAKSIEQKTTNLQETILTQQKEMQHLANEQIVTAAAKKRLEDSILIVREKHVELSERLKSTLHVLRSRCTSQTFAERKMAQDVQTFETNAKNLRVKMTETTAKVKYLNNQMNAQTEVARRLTKPLYLDKNRVVFIRSSLTSMQKNIKQLVTKIHDLNKLIQILKSDQNNESTCLQKTNKTQREVEAIKY